MKFFHLSDLHIGKQLNFYSLKEDQKAILEEIVQYARKLEPQAIVIAGDVYDKSVPSAEAVAVFDEFIRKLADLDVDILVISGNHDSPERLDFASTLLERQRLYIAGMVPATASEHLKKVTLSDEYGKVEFWLLPFLKPGYVRNVFEDEEPLSCTESIKRLLERENPASGMRKVLVTHQFYTASGVEPSRSDSETVYVGGAGNADISAVEGFDYVAMGHIHKAQCVGRPSRRYCGTLLKYSAGESRDEKSLTVVTLKEKGTEPVIATLPLHPLRDVKQMSGTLEELLRQGCEDYVSLTLTDERMPYQPREKLLEVFPNMLELKVENTRTRLALENMSEAGEPANPLERFEKFYEEVNGCPMNEEERDVMKQILEKAQEE